MPSYPKEAAATEAIASESHYDKMSYPVRLTNTGNHRSACLQYLRYMGQGG